MKVIISRKGFDSTAGGIPSPVINRKTMLSLPIPSEAPEGKDGCYIKYDDLEYNGVRYSDIIKSLHGRNERYCHLDPDIRKGIRSVPNAWQAAFGQVDAAETHLENHNVEIGDLFLFFGLFRLANWSDDQIKYEPKSYRKHMIFGYLQIGDIVRGEQRKDYFWHPHSNDYENPNNTIYVAAKKLVIDGTDTGLNGYGTFNYSDEIVLTKDSYSCTKWNLPAFFKDVTISFHNPGCFKPDYFQSRSRGQEFVISESQAVTDWAKKLILDNVDLNNQ